MDPVLLLQRMVEIPSLSGEEGPLAAFLVETMRSLGFHASIDQAGNAVGILGDGSKEILLLGHMDTVFDDGTAAARPFHIDGNRALGPGVSDMKGGLLGGLYATRALQDAGLDAFDRITFVCNPD